MFPVYLCGVYVLSDPTPRSGDVSVIIAYSLIEACDPSCTLLPRKIAFLPRRFYSSFPRFFSSSATFCALLFLLRQKRHFSRAPFLAPFTSTKKKMQSGPVRLIKNLKLSRLCRALVQVARQLVRLRSPETGKGPPAIVCRLPKLVLIQPRPGRIPPLSTRYDSPTMVYHPPETL